METKENPRTLWINPIFIASKAPNDAPPDTPSVKGDASEFLYRACKDAPHIAKVPPTMLANIILNFNDAGNI